MKIITNNFGRIINVTSGAPLNCAPGGFLYSSSKSALNVLTLTTSNECKEFNIKANLFSPGQIKTEMMPEAKGDPNKAVKFLKILLSKKNKLFSGKFIWRNYNLPLNFLKLVKEKSSELGIDEKFLSRQLNVGFSGGEKKKNEILQMKILQPKLAILDETDSGLDIDALRIVADGVNSYKNKNNAFLIITHYQRLLDYIKPDFIHVLSKGKIVKTGNADLGVELEKTGYANFI